MSIGVLSFTVWIETEYMNYPVVPMAQTQLTIIRYTAFCFVFVCQVPCFKIYSVSILVQ